MVVPLRPTLCFHGPKIGLAARLVYGLEMDKCKNFLRSKGVFSIIFQNEFFRPKNDIFRTLVNL